MARQQDPFGAILKELRNQRNMTQETFAEKIGVTSSAVAHYESGESYPAYKTLYKIVRVLEIDANLLFAYEPEELPTDMIRVAEKLCSLGKEQRDGLNEFLRLSSMFVNGDFTNDGGNGRVTNEDCNM